MNLLDVQEANPAKEIITVLWEDAHIRVEKIISFGQVTPENHVYCQKEAEWVSVLKGRGILYFPDTDRETILEAEWVSVLKGRGILYFPDTDRETILEAGDHMMILPGVRHSVIYTSKPCIWLCVFEKQLGAENEQQ